FFTSYTIDRINRVTLTPHSPHTTIFLSKFTWLDERALDRKLGYAEDSLVSDVTVSHPGLGISVRFEDYIDLARNWFIRNLSVTRSEEQTSELQSRVDLVCCLDILYQMSL